MNARHPIPGDQTPDQQRAEMIRVDHAGEYGAKRIYAGQLAVLGPQHSAASTIAHMAEQEQAHLVRFEELMIQHRVRPSALLPLWHVAGFALGAGTALMGAKAAMACTVAIESVISEHYAEQLDTLGEDEAELASTIAQFRAEEMEHHDIGLQEGAEQAPAYALLSVLIRGGCKLAIAVAKRV